MKKLLFVVSLSLLTLVSFHKTAPPARLKYFGFALVDCQLDDPNDGASTMTNFEKILQ